MTLYRWVNHYLKYGSFERLHRPTCSYKIRKVHVAEALHFLSLHKTVSIPALHAYLQSKFDDYSITDDHLRRVIRDNNFTRKRTRHGHYPKMRHKSPTDRKADLQAFYSVVSTFPIDKIVSIDETSLTPRLQQENEELQRQVQPQQQQQQQQQPSRNDWRYYNMRNGARVRHITARGHRWKGVYNYK